jgi:hypothetical protein
MYSTVNSIFHISIRISEDLLYFLSPQSAFTSVRITGVPGEISPPFSRWKNKPSKKPNGSGLHRVTTQTGRHRCENFKSKFSFLYRKEIKSYRHARSQ